MSLLKPRWARLATCLALALGAVISAHAEPAAESPAVEPSAAELEQQANRLKSVSEHLVCQCGCNMILSECSHQSCPFALPERREILKKLAEGQSEQQILDGYVASLGRSVLSTPPTEGSWLDRAVWLGPGVALVLGVLVALRLLVVFVRRARRAPVARLSDTERARIEAELERNTGGEALR